MLDTSLTELVEAAHKLPLLIEKVESLEAKIARLSIAEDDKFVPIEEAAKILGKSVSAIRQRMKHPRKPMPKGLVWKQDGPGCAIYVNARKYREYL